MKKHLLVILVILAIISILFVPACSKNKDDAIVIIYTTDVHCNVSENIGYAKLSAYVKAIKSENKNVTLIDAGDAIQGDFIGSISKGKYIVDIMNDVNYDLYLLGDHEFDYGFNELKDRIDEFNGTVLSCNIKYTGKGENKISKVKPYSIVDYGFAKVGYVGVTTPFTLNSSNPSNFKENDAVVYDFSQDDFINVVQSNVDKCHKEGCDYVVLVTHLGYTNNYSPFSSEDLIKGTSGVSAVIDGHSHLVTSCNYYENKDGAYIPLCTAGYKMNAIGRITIAKDGTLQVGVINSYPKVDDEVKTKIDSIKAQLASDINKVVATSDITLSCEDSDGVRMVRNREMAIGDLIADSIREISGAEIGFMNGGGIRTSIKSGDITYGDLKNVMPFNNTLCVVKATGQQIIDYLEFASRKVESEYKSGSNPVGEDGSFAQVSGLKYTIDTSIQTPVVTDSTKAFIRIEGERRVKDVLVLQGDEYIPIDLQRTYTISSISFILIDGGDGANMFLNSEIVTKNVMLDSEALTLYLMQMNGSLREKYGETGHRIIII